MKLIKPSVELISQEKGLQGIYNIIEKTGRVCYKSEDKIKGNIYFYTNVINGIKVTTTIDPKIDGEEAINKAKKEILAGNKHYYTSSTALPFVTNLIKRKHLSVLEHGTVYLCGDKLIGNKYNTNKYSTAVIINNTSYITTNYRVIIENKWKEDLKYLCEPTLCHIKRITIKFICDRGIANEFVRHRNFSFSQESTRYCNYSKDKFNNECTFIIPSWLDIRENSYCCYEFSENIQDFNAIEHKCVDGIGRYRYTYSRKPIECLYLKALNNAQQSYFEGLKMGLTAQQARTVLPLCLKTELIMTGTINQWKEFMILRSSLGAHPDAQNLVSQIPIKLI